MYFNVFYFFIGLRVFWSFVIIDQLTVHNNRLDNYQNIPSE